MRLFVALDIDEEIRRRIAKFRDQMRTLAPDVKWVGPQTFHITLQFLGETAELEGIQAALQNVRDEACSLNFRGAGFFPNSKAPRVFWIGIESDRHLQPLVASLASALAPLGFQHDAGPYTPHLTLARAGSGRPRPVRGEHSAPGLRVIADKLASLSPPEFGTMTAREFCLYESKLSAGGAQYTKLSCYRLR